MTPCGIRDAMLSNLTFDFPIFVSTVCILSFKSVISVDHAMRQTMPAARSISMFHVRTQRAFKSMLSLSTVGITEGAEMCAERPVVWWVGNPMKILPFFVGSTVAKTSGDDKELGGRSWVLAAT